RRGGGRSAVRTAARRPWMPEFQHDTGGHSARQARAVGRRRAAGDRSRPPSRPRAILARGRSVARVDGQGHARRHEPFCQGASMSEVAKIDKPWGYELHWAKTDRYVGKVIHVAKGHALSLQYHNQKDETIYLWSGKLLFEIEVDGRL